VGALELECEPHGARLIVRVTGDLDLSSAGVFRSRVDEWLAEGRCRDLLLNLRHVSFIDSVGLGAILGRLRNLQRQGGRMAIVEPDGPVKAILRIGGLDKVAGLFSSERAAMAAWEASERGA
jgi:stage II sporulation protein AA (anti-sigma F factor antagonist)